MKSFVLRARSDQGTGWLLWKDIVVTALHVVGTEGAAGQWSHDGFEPPEHAYNLHLPGGPVSLEPLIYDPRADVALLRLPESALASVPDDAFGVLSPNPPIVGDPWHATGFPAFEISGRAVSLRGVVSHVEPVITNNAMQLFVDQGTSVVWGGISGCPAQNAFGEVFGLVVQTVSGIATCNAAPVAAVPRLLALLERRDLIVTRLAERLRTLAPDAHGSIASEVGWSFPSEDPAWKRDPVAALSKRIAQSGPAGLGLALAAIAKISGDPTQDPELLALADQPEPRPTPDDVDAVLIAVVDAGGSVSAPRDLLATLPTFPAPVLQSALDHLLRRGSLEGPAGGASGAILTRRGAAEAIRVDYAHALLRALLGTDAATTAQLALTAGIAPRQLRRALVLAAFLGWIETAGPSHAITPAGRDELRRDVRDSLTRAAAGTAPTAPEDT